MVAILRKFIDFVQLPAKTACIFPFFLSLFYALAIYRHGNVTNTLIFFLSMLAFELSVTGLNSYIDTKTNGMELQFPRKTAKHILEGLLAFAVISALFLVFRAGLVVLILGGLCFLVGILYSYGPAPISRMPLGEVFSGIFEGFFIPFLVVYLNSPENSLIGYSFRGWVVQITLNLSSIFRLFILCIPAMLGIANIMLANNICDVEADIRVKRYTLPYYLGVQNSLRLFAANYYMAFFAVILTAVFRILPFYILAALLPFGLIQRNISRFQKLQSKTKTFPYSVKNFTFLMVSMIVVTGIAAFLHF